jgi:hypothetical protein
VVSTGAGGRRRAAVGIKYGGGLAVRARRPWPVLHAKTAGAEGGMRVEAEAEVVVAEAEVEAEVEVKSCSSYTRSKSGNTFGAGYLALEYTAKVMMREATAQHSTAQHSIKQTYRYALCFGFGRFFSLSLRPNSHEC